MGIPSRGLIKGKNDLATLFPDIAKEWDSEKNNGYSPDMVTAGSSEKAWWKCSLGHTWQALVSSRTRGIGCPFCSNKRILAGYNDLATTHPIIAAEWDCSKNGAVTPKEVTYGTTKKYWWICSNGHSYESSVAGRIRGRCCPICAGQTVLKGFNDLATVNPKLANEWNYTKNAPLTPDQITSGTRRKVWWICEKKHEWEASIASRGNGFGCPYCSGRIAIAGKNDLITMNPGFLKEWHPTKNGNLLPETFKLYSSKRIWWRCSSCGYDWEARISDRSKGNGCPACNRINRTSTPEQILFYYIHTVFPDTMNSYKPEWLSGHGQEFDIFIPCLSIVIEYDGVKWHKDLDKDRKKDLLARDHNLTMIRIREEGCPPIESSTVIHCYPNAYDMKYIEPVIEQLFVYFKTISNCISLPNVDIDKDLPNIIASYAVNISEKSLAVKYPDIAKEWNTQRNGHLTPSMIPANSNRKMWWKCSVCQHEWLASVNNRIRRGCPVCSNKKVVTGQNDLSTTNPEMLKYWDYSKNQSESPSKITAGSEKLVHWKCPDCGYEWTCKCWNQKKHNSCPVCVGKTVWSGHNDLMTCYPELMDEWDYEKNSETNPSRISPGTQKKVWWKCKTCGFEWQALIQNRTRGHGCPMCARQLTSVKNGKKVYCIETGKIYSSIAQAIAETGFSSIYACLNGKTNTAGGFHWKYWEP